MIASLLLLFFMFCLFSFLLTGHPLPRLPERRMGRRGSDFERRRRPTLPAFLVLAGCLAVFTELVGHVLGLLLPWLLVLVVVRFVVRVATRVRRP